MMKLEFEWDGAKAKANLLNHGVSFELATTVFKDPFASVGHRSPTDIPYVAEEAGLKAGCRPEGLPHDWHFGQEGNPT